MKKFLILGVVSLMLAGCEEEFAGNRSYTAPTMADPLNGPYQMRVVELDGTRYLAVLNTNYRFQESRGDIAFFSLADPTNPVLNESLSVPLRGIVSDFYLLGNRLFVLNRDLDQVEWYDYTNGQFVAALQWNGKPKAIELEGNIQSITHFTRPEDGASIFAIAAQQAGTVFFLKIEGDNMSLVTEPYSVPEETVIVVYRNGELTGAGFEMLPRRTTDPNRDDQINLSSAQRQGRGIYETAFINLNQKQILVAPLATGLGLFSFRFDLFVNPSNFAWDLPRFLRDHKNESGVRTRGSRESGFRGLAVDQAGNVYLSNRTDNELYQIPFSEISAESEGSITRSGNARNTRGFPRHDQTFKIGGLSFDDDRTDKVFPRLGALVTNCPPAVGPIVVTTCVDESNNSTNGAASVLWVLGLGSQKVYRVQGLTTTPQRSATSEALGEGAQKILWHPTANVLYVTSLRADRLTVLNDSDLSVIKQIVKQAP